MSAGLLAVILLALVATGQARVATRGGAHDLSESIIESAKVYSDHCHTTRFVTEDGNAVSGRLIIR